MGKRVMGGAFKICRFIKLLSAHGFLHEFLEGLGLVICDKSHFVLGSRMLYIGEVIRLCEESAVGEH